MRGVHAATRTQLYVSTNEWQTHKCEGYTVHMSISVPNTYKLTCDTCIQTYCISVWQSDWSNATAFQQNERKGTNLTLFETRAAVIATRQRMRARGGRDKNKNEGAKRAATSEILLLRTRGGSWQEKNREREEGHDKKINESAKEGRGKREIENSEGIHDKTSNEGAKKAATRKRTRAWGGPRKDKQRERKGGPRQDRDREREESCMQQASTIDRAVNTCTTWFDSCFHQ